MKVNKNECLDGLQFQSSREEGEEDGKRKEEMIPVANYTVQKFGAVRINVWINDSVRINDSGGTLQSREAKDNYGIGEEEGGGTKRR